MAPKFMSFIFVYGTLRCGISSPLDHIMNTHCVFVGGGSVSGRLYDIGRYPGLVSTTARTERVFGDVFRFRNEETALAELDIYEGCSQACPQPHEYCREIQAVRLSSGRTVEAWVYRYMHDVKRLRRIPGGDYLKWLALSH